MGSDVVEKEQDLPDVQVLDEDDNLTPEGFNETDDVTASSDSDDVPGPSGNGLYDIMQEGQPFIVKNGDDPDGDKILRVSFVTSEEAQAIAADEDLPEDIRSFYEGIDENHKPTEPTEEFMNFMIHRAFGEFDNFIDVDFVFEYSSFEDYQNDDANFDETDSDIRLVLSENPGFKGQGTPRGADDNYGILILERESYASPARDPIEEPIPGFRQFYDNHTWRVVCHEFGHVNGQQHIEEEGEEDQSYWPGVIDGSDHGTNDINEGVHTCMTSRVGFLVGDHPSQYAVESASPLDEPAFPILSSPGIVDLFGWQTQYGVEEETNLGDTVFRFLDEDQYPQDPDDPLTTLTDTDPLDNNPPSLKVYFDAGGNDTWTYDGSGYYHFDLRPSEVDVEGSVKGQGSFVTGTRGAIYLPATVDDTIDTYVENVQVGTTDTRGGRIIGNFKPNVIEITHGKAVVTGGGGKDTYRGFDGAKKNLDLIITDFEAGESGELIDITSDEKVEMYMAGDDLILEGKTLSVTLENVSIDDFIPKISAPGLDITRQKLPKQGVNFYLPFMAQ